MIGNILAEIAALALTNFALGWLAGITKSINGLNGLIIVTIFESIYTVVIILSVNISKNNRIINFLNSYSGILLYHIFRDILFVIGGGLYFYLYWYHGNFGNILDSIKFKGVLWGGLFFIPLSVFTNKINDILIDVFSMWLRLFISRYGILSKYISITFDLLIATIYKLLLFNIPLNQMKYPNPSKLINGQIKIIGIFGIILFLREIYIFVCEINPSIKIKYNLFINKFKK